MMRARAAALVSACGLGLMLGGCLPMLGSALGARAGVPVGDKVVTAKRAPSILVAMDGTECVVSREAWEKVEVGRPHFCAWHDPRFSE